MKSESYCLKLTFITCALLMGACIAPLGIAGAAQEQALQAVASYANPITGEVEDTGNNPGIGQGMTEELVLRTPAVLLVDAEGSTFITFRVGLVAESLDFALELLDDQGKAAGAVPYSIVAEHPEDNTQDIRIKVPSVDSMLRVSLVSIPMGREVVGFVQFAPEGEVVDIPVAEVEVDDEAISIYENAGNDEIVGVNEEDRGQLLMFLGVAGGILLALGAVAGLMALRKKKSGDID